MTKASLYNLDSYGPAADVSDPRRGVFELTDWSWALVFPDGGGLRCGLRHSDVEVAPVGRRRSRVTLADTSSGSEQATFVVRADAESVRRDLEERYRSLEDAAAVSAAIDAGEWWKDDPALDALGPFGTRSLAGTRCLGGTWEGKDMPRTWLAGVLDLGPTGVVWRRWRRRVHLAWPSVTTIDVVEESPPPRFRWLDGSSSDGGSTIVIRGGPDDEVRFHTMLSTVTESRRMLGPFVDRLTPAGASGADGPPTGIRRWVIRPGAFQPVPDAGE